MGEAPITGFTVFKCPECGAEMEISQRYLGEYVDCIACGEDVLVEPAKHCQNRRAKDEGLSSTEFMLYTILFLFIPGANVLVSSILYYVWNGMNLPVRATQINRLGFIIFGCQLVLGVLLLLASPILK